MVDELAHLLRQITHDVSTRNTSPSEGIIIDIGNALDEVSSFRPIDHRGEDADLVYELEWRGTGTNLADLNFDFYELLGRFAMQISLVRQEVLKDAVAYECLIGFTSEDTINLYRIQFRIIGARIRWVLSDKPFFPGYDSSS